MIVLSCKNISKSYGIDEILKDVTLSINEGDRVGIIGANGEGKSTLFIMIVLSCKNISKSYGIDEILKDVTLSINEGDRVGIIGANGEGKSTLFKILSKQLSFDDGEIFIDKNKTLGYLAQHLDLDTKNTIYNEMLLVFSDLIRLEEKLLDLENKMNEPYDESKADYHNKIINDYNTSQELYSHRGGYTYKGEINKVLKGLGFSEEDFDKEISKLSGGQKTRVALCKLLLLSPDILLLDEPTNHLDLEAIEWLEEYLKSYKGTILVISHDRFFLDSVTNRTFQVINGHVNCYNASYTKFLELREKDYDSVTNRTFQVINGHVNCYNASYTKFLELREKDYESQLKAYNLQQAEIKRQEAIIEKFRSFNREKSIRAAESREKALDRMEKIDAPDEEKGPAKIKFETSVKSGYDVFNREKSIRAAESREKALDRMEKIDAPDEEKGPAKIKFETSVKSGYDVLHVEKLSKSFGDKHLFSNLSLDLKRGEKIALIGENGRGKTTFFNILMDKIKPDSGVKVLGTNVNIGYYDQEQSNLCEDKTIIDEVWDDFPELTTSQVRGALATFLFTGEDVFKTINKLSGGEKCRINLLKLMLSRSNLLLLDEPTNHLDILSREALEDAILSYDGTSTC